MTSPNPAPYFIDEARAAICSRCPRTGETLTLCMFTGWGERDRATARVMIAATDLLPRSRTSCGCPIGSTRRGTGHGRQSPRRRAGRDPR